MHPEIHPATHPAKGIDPAGGGCIFRIYINNLTHSPDSPGGCIGYEKIPGVFSFEKSTT